MTESKFIPLNKLDADPKNVRKTYSAEGVEQLAASLLANGLLQNLIVRLSDTTDGYYVTAGGRRLKAFQHLAATDLPLKFHPAAIRASAVSDKLNDLVGATGGNANLPCCVAVEPVAAMIPA